MFNLLIVENDDVTRSLFQMIFKGDLWRLHITDCVRNALHIYRAEEVDLIVTDILLPGEDGTSLARTIRSIEQIEGRGRIPIIGISAGVQEAMRERCLQSGMDVFFSKPFKLDVIMTQIQDLLSAHSSR